MFFSIRQILSSNIKLEKTQANYIMPQVFALHSATIMLLYYLRIVKFCFPVRDCPKVVGDRKAIC